MVYLKRYGYKFFPLDGENTRFSFTRGFALGGAILLAFLFSGLDVPVVVHLGGFAAALFLISLIGEKWPTAGFALTLIAVIIFLALTIHLHYAGLGRNHGVGLLYVYSWVTVGLALSDLKRSEGKVLGARYKTIFVVFLAAFSVVGFAPVDRFIAASRTGGICWIEHDSYRRDRFHITFSHWLGGVDIGITSAEERSRYHRLPKAVLHSVPGDWLFYGEVVSLQIDKIQGQDILGLDLRKRGRHYVQWVGPVTEDCRFRLHEFTGI